MGTYNYKVRDRFGKLIIGVMDDKSEGDVAVKLKAMGYIPVSINEAQKAAKLRSPFTRFKRVGFSDLNMFTRGFATLQKAGLPILSSFNALREQVPNNVLKNALGEIIKDIKEGVKLSSAFGKHADIFNPLYVNMIESGEASGTLDEALERLAVLGEHEEKIRLRIMGATTYPIIVIVAITLAFLFLTWKIVPRFADLYSRFTTALPIPTQILLFMNYVITKFWWIAVIIITAFIFTFIKLINTKKGRCYWDTLKLKVPVFGPLVLELTMSRFTRITATLMRSGVPLLRVLELASGAVGNVMISNKIDEIKAGVAEGKGMAGPMKITGMFPPVVVQMVSAGEESGKVDELLLHVSNYYDSQIEHTINNLTALIEPMLIFILGCGVLFMALGIFLPMWNLMSLFRK